MTKFKQYLWIFGFMLLASACTQEPARVEDRSSQFYGREPSAMTSSPYHENYAADSPHYAAPASVPVVGVSDLPPPSRNSPATTAPSQWPSSHVASAENDGRFIWPVAGGKVVSHFGPKAGGKANDGINISVSEGEPVWAAADGMVVYAGNQLPSYGNMIIVRHDGGWMTAYAHTRSISVKKNDYVKQGEIIGYVGMTGNVKTPQLHFALRNGKTPVDPEQYLPKS
jgi:murein DD-endopeptidase MepM/ murein hydrolase activator NlpD